MRSETRAYATGRTERVSDITHDCAEALGTWQSGCLVDLNVDNPDREVRLSFLEG
ncbi:MAG: hypothetical protein ABI873_04890 [Marmoricola sp.]